jgi:hypothetical protein
MVLLGVPADVTGLGLCLVASTRVFGFRTAQANAVGMRADLTFIVTVLMGHAGPVVLDGLRVNQLSLARRLSGEMALTEPRLLLKGRGGGRQGNELLELDLALPPSPLAARPAPGPDGKLPLLLYCPPAFAAAHAVAVQQVPSALQQQQQHGAAAGQQQHQQQGASGGDGDNGEAGDDQHHHQQQQLASAAAAVAEVEPGLSDAQRVSHVLLRRGDLHFSSTVSC